MSIDTSGMMRGFRTWADQQQKAALAAVDEFGEHVMGEAQQNCPVDTGALRASGTTEPAESKNDRITKTIGFNTDYAAIVHEQTGVHHDVGGPKYLENAMRDEAPKMSDFVGKRMREASR